MLKDILQFITTVIIIFTIVVTVAYTLGATSCYNTGKMLKTPSMYSFDKCYVMNADGDYIPEEVYIELLKYGE